MLKVENLSFSYGKKKILKSLNLQANAGEFIALLGANGSGKSTLFKCILKLLHAQNGSIFIDGQDLSALNHKELASIISYVPQRSTLMMALSVKDFILLGLYAAKKGLFLGFNKDDYELANSFARRFNLEPSQNVLSLSGGEFGRALMARALISKPKIILLDEPTSAMDLRFSVAMMKECAALAENGLCVVAIIHDLNLAAHYCQRFAMLKDGHLAHFGGSELINSSVLHEVFELECEVINHKNSSLVVY